MLGCQLPKRTEYILRSLTCLAKSGSRLSARAIAAREQIPASFLAKVLYQLTWHSLVSSRRGPGGGFALTRPPAQIRVKQVLEIFQVPSPDEERVADDFARAWEKVWEPTRRRLETLTLADLLEPDPLAPLLERTHNSAASLRKSVTRSLSARARAHP